MLVNGRGRTQILIRFGYDGARFFGLQPQGDRPTAGAALRERLRAAAAAPEKALQFAARTDRGVHAVANLATCWFAALDAPSFLAALAADRDDGLTDVRGFVVPMSVHARGAARGKRYAYIVLDGRADRSAPAARAWTVAPQLDVAAMNAAAQRLVGVHDFTSFRSVKCRASSPVKELASARVIRRDDGAIVIVLAGTAFLRQMVRILVGVLVEVGAHLRAPGDIDAILAARRRSAAGITAPPEGLTLDAVGCAWPDDGSFLLAELAHRGGAPFSGAAQEAERARSRS